MALSNNKQLLSQFLWVRNPRVPELCGSGSQLSCWPGLLHAKAHLELEELPPHGCGQQPQLLRSLSVLPAWRQLPSSERSKSKVDTAVFFYDPASEVTFCHFSHILLSMPPCHGGTIWIAGPSWRLATTSGSLFGSRASLSSSVKWSGCTLTS